MCDLSLSLSHSGLSENQVSFRLGEFWKFTQRIPYFMKSFHSFFERHHRFHLKLKQKCEFCASLKGVYQDDSPLILAPIQLFKPRQGVAFKPPVSRSPSIERGNQANEMSEKPKSNDGPGGYIEEDGTVAGYSAQEIFDLLWEHVQRWMVNGMKGTLIMYLKGMALLTNPEDVVKNQSKDFRKVIPKPQLPTMLEHPPPPQAIDISSNAPFSLKVNDGKLVAAKKKAFPSAKSFFYHEAEESEAEGGEEGDRIGQKQKRVRLTTKVEDDDVDDHDYDRLAELEEGEIKDDSDDSGISEFLSDDRVIGCNNQEEARQAVERLRSTKNFPQYENTGAGARNLDAAIKNIMADVERQKREKQRQNEQQRQMSEDQQPGCSSSQGVRERERRESGILTNRDLNMAEALRQARQGRSIPGLENQIADDELYESGSDDDLILAGGGDMDMRAPSEYIEPSQSLD